MSRIDWLVVGMQLLGCYFGVVGLASLFVSISGAVTLLGAGGTTGAWLMQFGSFLQTITYLAASFLLIRRTGWMLRQFGYQSAIS